MYGGARARVCVHAQHSRRAPPPPAAQESRRRFSKPSLPLSLLKASPAKGAHRSLLRNPADSYVRFSYQKVVDSSFGLERLRAPEHALPDDLYVSLVLPWAVSQDHGVPFSVRSS